MAKPKKLPTLAEARALFAVKGIAAKECRKCRDLLEPGQYGFALTISGKLNRSAVEISRSGVVDVCEDEMQERAPEGKLLVAGVLSCLPIVQRDLLCRKLPTLDLQELPEDLVKQAEVLIARLRTSKPARGEVKVTCK